jgi:hypothetical protein
LDVIAEVTQQYPALTSEHPAFCAKDQVAHGHRQFSLISSWPLEETLMATTQRCPKKPATWKAVGTSSNAVAGSFCCAGGFSQSHMISACELVSENRTDIIAEALDHVEQFLGEEFASDDRSQVQEWLAIMLEPYFGGAS